MKSTLSMKLLQTLHEGRSKLSNEALRRVTDFVLSQKADDDSFVNKNGVSDVYYTMFGWSLSHTLNIPLERKKMLSFIINIDIQNIDIIHSAAYMRCLHLYKIRSEYYKKWLASLPHYINRHTAIRRKASNEAETPYECYIRLSLFEDAGLPDEELKHLSRSLEAFKVEGGGYSNIRNKGFAGVNATAAALAVIGQTEGYKKNADVEFLREMQHATGGFMASQATDYKFTVPDLLSTATALFVLKCYGIKPKYDARDFIESHWLESGGFAATIMDDKSDVEYTFYGLLALGGIENG